MSQVSESHTANGYQLRWGEAETHFSGEMDQGQKEPRVMGSEAVENVIVRVEVEDMGSGGIITCIVDPEVVDTAADLEKPIRIPLCDIT